MPRVVKKVPSCIRETLVPEGYRQHGKYEPYCDGRIWRFDAKDVRWFGLSCIEALRSQFFATKRKNKRRVIHSTIRAGVLYVQVTHVGGGKAKRHNGAPKRRERLGAR